MKFSKMFVKTFKEAPKDADSLSHALLIRAGMIFQNGSGLYSFLPMGNRVLKKIIKIIEEEMDAIGAELTSMPSLASKSLWDESQRWDVYGAELMRIKDRKGRFYALSPTAEELFVDIVRKNVKSYKELPLLLYQLSAKYRDEIRPRFGLMRSREFYMKDAYSFHSSVDSLDKTFEDIKGAYNNIFNRMGLDFKVCDADSGAIGGNNSQEFIVMTDSGEAAVVHCTNCGYSSNIEKAEGVALKVPQEDEKQLELISTPNIRTIKELSEYEKVSSEKCLKSMLYKDGADYLLVVLRGDHDINELKLASLLKSSSLVKASDKEIEDSGLKKGFIGPVDVKIKIVADLSVPNVPNHYVGANKEDSHLKNVNYGKDWSADMVGDIREVMGGDLCSCGNNLKSLKGIEVGHIFKIGQKYSNSMGCHYVDGDSKSQPMEMGCYGIGVSRVLASVVEQQSDDRGIRWPWELAPFHISIIVANIKDRSQMEIAEDLYKNLKINGFEVVLDDRDFRIGFKRKDSELLGIPILVIVGENISKGNVELFNRYSLECKEVSLSKALEGIKAMSKSMNKN